MNLSQLKHLVALAEHRSFRKAADALCLTQPALSRSIQNLEAELNVTLIDRVGRRNTLTAYGESVVSRARRMLFEEKELRRGLELLNSGLSGSLNIGLGPGPSAVISNPLLQSMARDYPRIQLTIVRGRFDYLMKSLREELVDAVVIDQRNLGDVVDLEIEPLQHLRAGFICRSTHPLLTLDRSVTIRDVSEYPVASTFLSEEVSRNLMEQLGPEAHPSKLITLRSEEIPSLIETACKTDAIFLGIIAAARREMDAGILRELLVTPVSYRVGRFALVTLAGRTWSPAMKLFQTFCREHFHD